MLRTMVMAALCAVVLAGQASAETIELRCRQEASEIYSLSRMGMVSMTYPDPVDVVISLDTEADSATLDPGVGMYSVGEAQVLIMMVSAQMREVWDIDRATGRAIVIAYLIDEPRTVFIRREAQCDLPTGMAP